MIIATAGHVDHGKTTLIKALTGVDTDRLPEEKARGLTVDLGFAYLPLGAGISIGFIDVPGHERFVHNMLCGVAGIDAVLLIVAADDGVMPQTREHLAILDLLGVRVGVVALTKIDRVPAERAAQVDEEIRALLAPTTLADAPVFPLCARSGDGVAAVQAHLRSLAQRWPERPNAGNFRLSVDRSFSIAGAGLIVTGTVHAGRVSTGESVQVQLAGQSARVRGIHAQNAPATQGRAGQRCALNLAGSNLDPAGIRRGDWIVAGRVPPPVRKIDVRLRVLPGEMPLRHWTPVHVHLGAADVNARVATLEGGEIAPGSTGLAQLVLERPVGAVFGDRLILRDQSARRTIGGGRVIDVFTPVRGRARPDRVEWLRGMEQVDHAAALRALVASSAAGVLLEQFAANRNLSVEAADGLFASAAMQQAGSGAVARGFSASHWQALRDAVLAGVRAFHQKSPAAAGIPADRVLDGTGMRIAREAMHEASAQLVTEGVLARAGSLLHANGHQSGFDPADAALWDRIRAVLAAQPKHPPTANEIATELALAPRAVQGLLERAARARYVYRIADSRFFLPDTLVHLAQLAQAVAQQQGGQLAPGPFREQSALGRNLAIEVLEFFDRSGYTRRVGAGRIVLRPASEVFGTR